MIVLKSAACTSLTMLMKLRTIQSKIRLRYQKKSMLNQSMF